MTDTNGNAKSSETYKAYGEGITGNLTTTNYRWIGGETDQSGLYYFNARYYSPETGRFISIDPAVITKMDLDLSIEEICNPYMYARNNPIRYTDPTGMKITSDIPETNDAILNDITLLAGEGFFFDDNNQLQLDTNVTPSGNYDQETRDALISFIDGEYKDIDVFVLYSTEFTVSNNGASGTSQNLGFTSYADPEGNSYRVGVPHPLLMNQGGESASILQHEFMGHLLPTVRGETGGNAVFSTLPTIKDLGLTIPVFLQDAWGPAAEYHDGALPSVDEQGWTRPAR